MSPRAAAGDGPAEQPPVGARPAPPSEKSSAAEDFDSVLNVSGAAAGEPAEALPEAAPVAAEAPAEAEVPVRRVGSVVGSEREAAVEAEPALDRPGAPVLAGAAIAGLILVAAPFAVVTGGGAVSLDVTAGGEPIAESLSGQSQNDVSGDGGSSGETGSTGSAAADGGNGSPVTDTPPDTGYVPEVREDLSAPTMPDPGDAGGGSAVHTSSPGGEAVGAEPPVRTGTEPDPGATGPGTADTPRDGTDAAAAPEGSGAADDTADGGPAERAPAEGDPAESGPAGDAPAEGAADGQAPAQGDGTVAEDTAGSGGGQSDDTPAEALSEPGSTEGSPPDTPHGDGTTGPEAVGPQDPPVTDDGGANSSVMEAVTERFGPAEESYLAVAGPGCPASTEASYGHEGRWDTAEGTDGWATRPGGYGGEGCAGDYDAVPVSGDPEQGNGQYAVWTFSPGREGVSCELYVHVPDDESPLWVAPGESRYLIRPGSGTEEPPAAVFGFDQSQVRGGWVQVTGFVTPAEEFSIELTNTGADPLAAEEGTSSHVAASAVRASCS